MRTVPVARRMVWSERARFSITTFGIVITVMLMLFLFGLYEGVKDGAISYMENSPADIWVGNSNTTNLMRSASFLDAKLSTKLNAISGIDEVTGLLQVIITTQINQKNVSMLLLGIDSESELTAPPEIVEGTGLQNNREIILDKVFAKKNELKVGDSLHIQNTVFKVVGISGGTNLLVSQFAFVTLDDAELMLRIPDVVSFFAISCENKNSTDSIINKIKGGFTDLSVFTKQEFVRNNLEEVKTGILPVLWTIAIFGSIAGIIIITLLLYGSILEKSEDFALLKALGAGRRYLATLILKQSLISAWIGFILGMILNFAVAPLITGLVPEISLIFTFKAAVFVFAASMVIGILSSLVPIHKLEQVYPAEVFRA